MNMRPGLASEAAEVTGADSFLPPKIPRGRYVVQSVRHDVKERMFEERRRVLALECEVIEPREYDGTRLTWYAPLPASGRRYPPGSKFMKAWLMVMGRRSGRHPAIRDLEGKRFVAIVDTVKRSHERDEHKKPITLPEDCQYSIIRVLVERA